MGHRRQPIPRLRARMRRAWMRLLRDKRDDHAWRVFLGWYAWLHRTSRGEGARRR